MNGTEFRSFSDFEILTYIPYGDFSKKFEDWQCSKFVFIHSKTVKVSQDDQIPM